jgi:hypothetical protein
MHWHRLKLRINAFEEIDESPAASWHQRWSKVLKGGTTYQNQRKWRDGLPFCIAHGQGRRYNAVVVKRPKGLSQLYPAKQLGRQLGDASDEHPGIAEKRKAKDGLIGYNTNNVLSTGVEGVKSDGRGESQIKVERTM